MFIICYRTPCAKSGCSGDTFWGNWLLLFLMMFHHNGMVRSSWIMITMFIICYRDPMWQIWVQWSHFWGKLVAVLLWCFITTVWSGHHNHKSTGVRRAIFNKCPSRRVRLSIDGRHRHTGSCGHGGSCGHWVLWPCWVSASSISDDYFTWHSVISSFFWQIAHIGNHALGT